MSANINMMILGKKHKYPLTCRVRNEITTIFFPKKFPATNDASPFFRHSSGDFFLRFKTALKEEEEAPSLVQSITLKDTEEAKKFDPFFDYPSPFIKIMSYNGIITLNKDCKLDHVAFNILKNPETAIYDQQITLNFSQLCLIKEAFAE